MARYEIIGLSLVAAMLSGCILEDNPAFVPGSTDGTSMGTGQASADTGSPTGRDDGNSGDDGGPVGTPEPGCDDPSLCTTFHVGPNDNSCAHDVDGVPTLACDWWGRYGLRIAAGTLELEGYGGLIVLHDNAGVPTEYVGSFDVPPETTIRAAQGLSADAVRVFSQDTDGVLRLTGNRVHLHGFTVVVESLGGWGISTRKEMDGRVVDSSGHLIENMVIAALGPEDVGNNSILQAIPSVGPDTVIRNNHIWGYFEGSMDMQFAANSVFSHNTLIYFQPQFADVAIDAKNVTGLEISNNVLASLASPLEAFVRANESSSELVVVGNAIEGADVAVGGIGAGDSGVVESGNTVDALELESPRTPRVLDGSTLRASDGAVRDGVSLDGVALADADVVFPGAYQVGSVLSVPRRTVIRVGDAVCGDAKATCDVVRSADNELQRAAWSAWPGASIEIEPSAQPYAGPMLITWPVEVRGTGGQAAVVNIVADFEDEVLESHGLWARLDGVVTVAGPMAGATLIEMLSIQTNPNRVGIFHEGRSGAVFEGRHEIRRVILRDTATEDDGLARAGLVIGDDTVVHDTLIQGAYSACLRFGPRSHESDPTPSTTSYAYNITCRLMASPEVPDEGEAIPLVGFEVASVADAVMANIVIDFAEPGVVLRAQRRSGEDPSTMAEDLPESFIAHSFLVRGSDALINGFDPAVSAATLTSVDTIETNTPLFVSDVDSHLVLESAAVDSGEDVVEIQGTLSLGLALDGVERPGEGVDRGCYEQGGVQ